MHEGETAQSRNAGGGYGIDLPEILHRLVVTAVRAVGFAAVTVNLRRTDGSFAVVADTGGLLDSETSGEFWEALLRGGIPIGGSYLIPPAHARSVSSRFPEIEYVIPDMPPAEGPEDWDPDHMLVVPLLDRQRQPLGYVSVDAPLDGKLPSREVVSDLETFAQHAALTVEHARLLDGISSELDLLNSLIQNSSDIVTLLDADGRIRYTSSSIRRVLGYEPEARVGGSTFELIHPDDQERARSAFAASIREPGVTLSVEVRMRHADGSWRYIEANGINLLADPSVRAIVLNSRDITERKAFQTHLEYQAFYDALTGLPNRALFLDRVRHALAHAERRKAAIAVLFLDLDRLKVVNDSLGHGAGDGLLVAVATRLGRCIRPEDTFARLSGDEFAVLLETTDASDAVRVAERLLRALESPFAVAGREVFITASIGIVLNASQHEQPEDLLRDADVAMYRAKQTGKARYQVFDAELGVRATQRLERELDLRRALDRGEFIVLYQPMVDLRTGNLSGWEALLRWRHPERGLLSPGGFLDLAEEVGLSLPIGQWVLREACRQAREWQAQFPSEPAPTMWVNLSARQFEYPKLAAEIAQTLRGTQLQPGALGLEVTESMMIGGAGIARAALRELKGLGVRLAIDDFGTGYSSLAYLRRFPLDTLKIDQSFVIGLGENAQDTAIVEAVILLAKALGMRTTAEGVTTDEQVALLRARGCDLGQGYLYARPLTVEAAGELLRTQDRGLGTQRA